MKFTGIKDLDQKIMEELDDTSLLKFCAAMSNKSNDSNDSNEFIVFRACDDDLFWKKRTISKYGNFITSNETLSSSWKKFYLKIIYYSEIYQDKNKRLYAASEKGDLDLVKFFVSQGAYEYTEAMKYATKGGHLDIIKFLFDKEKRMPPIILAQAVRYNKKNIIDYYFEKGGPKGQFLLDKFLYEAFSVRNNELIDFFLKLGANKESVLKRALKNNDQELLEFINIYK